MDKPKYQMNINLNVLNHLGLNPEPKGASIMKTPNRFSTITPILIFSIRDSASGDRTRKLKRRTQLRKVIPAIIVILGILLAIGGTGYSNDAEKHFVEGKAKWYGGEYEGAIKALDKAIELKPDYAEAYRTQGTAKAVLKQHFSYLQAETTVGLEKVQ